MMTLAKANSIGSPLKVQHHSSDTSAISSQLDLDVAVQRLYRNIISGCFPNRLDAAILRRFPDDVKSRVEDLIEDTTMDWANGSARFFDLPKQDGLVRPICYINVEVAIAYQALVDRITAVIEPYVSSNFDDRILSHRLRDLSSPAMYQRSQEAYGNYIHLQHRLANSGTYSHCLRLDIANYYERIYHHKLQQLLERRGVPGSITSALCKLLRKFANGDSHGIPQGFWASDYLGSIYLLYLDEFLEAKDIHAVRYVDDYRIFCGSDREARSILKDCCGMLRGLGLNVQPRKTSIVTVDKLDPELKPITERFLDLRQNAVFLRPFDTNYLDEDDLWEQEHRETPITDENVRDFEDLWTEAIDQEDKRTALLTFALSGLSAAASPTAEQYILDNLGQFPNLASAFTKYLLSLGFKQDTANRILDFIESDECIHEWQQMWLLEYFRRTSDTIEPYKTRLKALLHDSNIHPLCRALISEIIAFKGTDTDGDDVQRLFTRETDPRIRRHLLLGFRLLPLTERNYAISYLPPSDWILSLVGKLVKSNAKLLDTN